MEQHTQQFLQRRKFYMVLPLLVLPFTTMIFWALGGGQTTSVQAEVRKPGLNLELPGAQFKKGEELWDKLSLYDQAKRDSVKYEEARKNDPYYEIKTLKGTDTVDTIPNGKLNASLGTKDKYHQIGKNEALIERKLEQLQNALDKPSKPNPDIQAIDISDQSHFTQSNSSEDIDRLEQMMNSMAGSDVNDPEMQQIETMLDKILDIQHPQRVKEKMNEKKAIQKKGIKSVAPVVERNQISLLEAPRKSLREILIDSLKSWDSVLPQTQNYFFGLEEDKSSETEYNTIEAVIHETQTVVAGSTIKIRLLNDLNVNGDIIKKDQFVFGTCAINNERLTISINSIRNEKSVYPVDMTVFDLDGMQGIYIPGAISRDVAKQAAAQSIQDVQLYSMDNSLEVQAATAGIEATKSLFSKKAKLVKVTVKAGYHILLQDSDQSNL